MAGIDNRTKLVLEYVYSDNKKKNEKKRKKHDKCKKNNKTCVTLVA